jgi:hypothetical protein
MLKMGFIFIGLVIIKQALAVKCEKLRFIDKSVSIHFIMPSKGERP